MISSIDVSTANLVIKLTSGLTGAADSCDTVGAVFQLLIYLLRNKFSNEAFLIDPKMGRHCFSSGLDSAREAERMEPLRSVCDETLDLLQHLWVILENWAMRVEPSWAKLLFECLLELIRFSSGCMSEEQFSLLITQPWNCFVILHSIDSPLFGDARPVAVLLGHHIMEFNHNFPLLGTSN